MRTLALSLALALTCTVVAQTSACASTSSKPTAASSTPADRVLLGPVWTGDPAAPRAAGVAITGGVIVGVGDEAALSPFITATNTTRVAGLITPGLIDAHVHPLGAGRQEQGCSLQGQATVDALRARIRACHDKSADKTTILFGRGWNLSLFKNANPNRALLDEIVGDRPAYFRGEDGHSGWANSAMLQKANITKDTPNPENGVIERAADGTPSGTLREDAIELVEKLLPEPTLADDTAALTWAMEQLAAHGITSIMDAGLDDKRLAAYAALASARADKVGLPVDVVGCIVVDPNDGVEGVLDADELRNQFANIPRLQVRCAKIFLDGVLEGETAALLAPYENHADHTHKGALATTQEKLTAMVLALETRGYQVHMHVIGDAAARAALDAFATARATGGPRGLRHTLAHLQLVDAKDHPRFAQLDVTVNAQSYWAYPDTYIVDINTPQVGQARVDAMYPWGSLARAGARVVGGSDWPVSTVNPLDAIETMVRRQDPAKGAGPVLGKNEELTLDAALAAYTANGAYLLRREADLGVIKVGAQADVVVYDKNLTAMEAVDLNAAHVVLTLKAGAPVFTAP
jgi:predicted amidohydrolase YtcJ